ncbi:hypothetical protein ACP70R_005907 [Stipagrostis hirtigluma subsp. patula]
METQVYSLDKLQELFFSCAGPQLLRIVRLRPQEAPEMADCLRAIAPCGWIVRNDRRVFGLARLENKLMVVYGVTMPRILRNNADGVVIDRLRQHAEELLELARRIGGSVVAPTEQLRDLLVELAATAQGWDGSDGDNNFWASCLLLCCWSRCRVAREMSSM